MSKKDNQQKDILDDLVITGGGNVVGGDTIRVSGDVVNVTLGGNLSVVNLDELKSAYLAYVQFSNQTIGLNNISISGVLPPRFSIENIYVPLSAIADLPSGEAWKRNSSPVSNQQDVVPVDSILGEQSRVVILGDPGSGKTTLLKNFALQLSKREKAPIPILIPLNAYAEVLNRADKNLQQFLVEYFSGITQGISNLEPLFNVMFEQGQVVVLLDGLDECDPKIRSRLVSKIEAFANESIQKGNKFVVTSRLVGYRQTALDPQKWDLYTLVDFGQQEIERFILHWFLEFEKAFNGNEQQATETAQRLIKVIHANSALQSLASNPLLLVVLIQLFYHNGALPVRRVDLYEQYLRILISTWNSTRAIDSRATSEKLDYFQTASILGKFAFWLKQENPATGIIPEEQLFEWLTDYYSGDEWKKPRGEAMLAAQDFMNNVKQRSNILIERGAGYYGFIHLAIEEHLAARGLIQLSQENSIDFIRENFKNPVWQEVIYLAFGLWILRGQSRVAGEALIALSKSGVEEANFAKNILKQLGENNFNENVVLEIQKAI